MAMKYDVISAIFKNRTDGQSATGAGGITAATTVRHGEAQADSADGFVEVLLDGSDMTVTVACEATIKKGQRVTVINMGGIYKVVSLGDLQDQIDEIAGSAGGWEDALDKATKELSAKIDEARKTATNYITTDATGAIVITDTNSESTKSSAIFDAYGTRIRRGDTDYATFGEVTKLGSATEYQTWVSKNGIQFYDGSSELLGTITTNTTGPKGMSIAGKDALSLISHGGAASGGAYMELDESASMGTTDAYVKAGRKEYSSTNIQNGIELWAGDFVDVSALKVIASSGANTAIMDGKTPSISINNFGTNSAINIYRRNSNVSDAVMSRVQLNKDHAVLNYGEWWYEALPTKLHMGVTNGYINVGKIGDLADGTADADSYFVALRAKRLAMGLNTTSVGELAYNAQWKTGCYLRKWGPVVTADIKFTVPSGGWAAGKTHAFGTVGEGFKPSALFRANAALTDASGRGTHAFVYCDHSGTVAIYNPLSIPAGTDLIGQLVWFASV